MRPCVPDTDTEPEELVEAYEHVHALVQGFLCHPEHNTLLCCYCFLPAAAGSRVMKVYFFQVEIRARRRLAPGERHFIPPFVFITYLLLYVLKQNKSTSPVKPEEANG